MGMPQEPLHAEIHRPNAAPQDRAARFARACARMDMSAKRCRARDRNTRFCASLRNLQSKYAWTCHKSYPMREFAGKKRAVRTPQCGHAACGKKAFTHRAFTQKILYRGAFPHTKILPAEDFTHRIFCTQELFRREALRQGS